MRILQITTKVPFPPKDGGAAGVFIFSKSFVKAGHLVQILAVNPPKHFVSPGSLGTPENLSIIPVPVDTTPRILPLLKNLFFESVPYQITRFIKKSFGNQLVKAIHEFHPDIIQLEGIYLCPYIDLIRRHTKAGIVLREHNIEYMLWKNIADHEHNFIKKTYLKIQAGRMEKYEINQIKKVDAFTTVTEDDLEVLKKIHGSVKYRVVPFGIEMNSSLLKNNEIKAVSFIGALDWMPNQEAIGWFVSEVWQKMQDRFPGLEFHIAGRNSPQSLSELLKNTRGIVFHGEVEDSAKFLEQFTVMIVPLFSGSGIRVKIIEAMQRGMVVIASSKAVKGIPGIPGKHFLIADCANEFISQLEYLISNRNAVKQISADAAEFISEKFNILVIASELITFYNEINNG